MKRLGDSNGRNFLYCFIILHAVLELFRAQTLSNTISAPVQHPTGVNAVQQFASLNQSASNQNNTKGNDPGPTCYELMQQGHSAFADGSFLTRKTTKVVWKMRHDGSRELTLPLSCRLTRYTAKEARQCLAGKSLLFIGDSLTRYQYLSFAYFLEYNKFPPRFQAKSPCNQIDEHGFKTCSEPDDPNVCAEGDWLRYGGWPAYLQSLGGGVDGGLFNGRMEAHTLRNGGKAVENMKYVTAEGKNDLNDGGRVTFSYAMESGWEGSEYFSPGWNFTGCAFTGTCRYTPEQYEEKIKLDETRSFDWNYTKITDALQKGSSFAEQHLGTNYVLYNRGLWGRINQNTVKDVMELMYNFTGGKESMANRCFFRSTTGCERTRSNGINNYEYTTVRRATYDGGCEYVDVAHLTEEFSTLFYNHPPPARSGLEYGSVFWDAVHYQPWVYEELNQVLLNILCNSQKPT
mmetsp:Transcript_54121/g.114988  ORF Transcript_54121/g.114988 Transcript_54121/m.114988 type:complete len:460 (-) Transcript_54121:207-1586(-)